MESHVAGSFSPPAAGVRVGVVEGDDLKFQAAFNIDLKPIPEIRIKLGQGITGYCASRGEAIIADDLVGNVFFILSLGIGGLCAAMGYGIGKNDPEGWFENSPTGGSDEAVVAGLDLRVQRQQRLAGVQRLQRHTTGELGLGNERQKRRIDFGKTAMTAIKQLITAIR